MPKLHCSNPYIAFLGIAVFCLVAPWIQIKAIETSNPETQTKSSYKLTASSLETNIFLPTLTSDQMSFTKLNPFTEKKKRFKPRLPKSMTLNKTITTEPTTIQPFDDAVLEEEVPQEVSSPSPTSLSAKRNFFRRRRKPNIKTTLSSSNEGSLIEPDTVAGKSKNETAVDIIMKKIKRAQQFKSGRKFFHSSSSPNKHRKRLIKSRSRFRPPITTDKTIPNTSTAPILATNEKLMRIAANRRKKQVRKNLLSQKDDKISTVEEEHTTTEPTSKKYKTTRRRPFSKDDWSKKTNKPSLVGAKLKAMRDKRKNKYRTFKSQKTKDEATLGKSSENGDLNPLSIDTREGTIPNTSKNASLPKNQTSRKIRPNKYPRVVIHRPIKKTEIKEMTKLNETEKNDNSKAETFEEDITEVSTISYEDALKEKDETTQKQSVEIQKGDVLSMKAAKETKKHIPNLKKDQKSHLLNLGRKRAEMKLPLIENVGLSSTTETVLLTTPTNADTDTTERIKDLKLSATTQRFQDEVSELAAKETVHTESTDGDEFYNLHPDVQPEESEPEPAPPTQPKLDWSRKRKKYFSSRSRKNILKGSFVSAEDSQFSASENEESVVGNYPEEKESEEESAIPEFSDETQNMQTLLDIDTFGVTQRTVDGDNPENFTPKVKRKITNTFESSKKTFQQKAKKTIPRISQTNSETYPMKEILGEENEVEESVINTSDHIQNHLKTVPDLDTQEGKRQNSHLGIESLASLVNLPSSFDSINDEDNFIYTDIDLDLYGKRNNNKPLNEQIIDRRQDTEKTHLEDIIETENEENGDLVTEALDNDIISELEKILEIHIPDESRIRRKNSMSRIIRRQNSLINHIIPSQDFIGVLPNGTSLETDEEPTYSFRYAVLDSSSGNSHSRKEESDDTGKVTGSYEVEYPGCQIRRVDYNADSEEGFKVLSVTRRSCTSGEITREDLPVEHWDKHIFGYKVLPSSETKRNPDQIMQRIATTSLSSLFEDQVTPNPFDGPISTISRRTPSITYLGDATNFNGKLPIGYLPLQPSSRNPQSSFTGFEESTTSKSPVSTRKRTTTTLPTSTSIPSSVKPTTTVRSTTTSASLVKPVTTERAKTTSKVLPKKTTPPTKQTTRKKSILSKKFTPKTEKTFVVGPLVASFLHYFAKK